jgi:hypothetical protein
MFILRFLKHPHAPAATLISRGLDYFRMIFLKYGFHGDIDLVVMVVFVRGDVEI